MCKRLNLKRKENEFQNENIYSKVTLELKQYVWPQVFIYPIGALTEEDTK